MQARHHGPRCLVESQVALFGITPNLDDALIEFTLGVLEIAAYLCEKYSHYSYVTGSGVIANQTKPNCFVFICRRHKPPASRRHSPRTTGLIIIRATPYHIS